MKEAAPSGPPPSPKMKLPTSTSGHWAEEVTMTNQNERRRRLFDVLFEGTKEGALANLAGHIPHIPGTADGVQAPLLTGFANLGEKFSGGNPGEHRINVRGLLHFLKQQNSPALLADIWVVVGLKGSLPAQTTEALRTISAAFTSMDHDGSGQVSFEQFSRYINRTSVGRPASKDSRASASESSASVVKLGREQRGAMKKGAYLVCIAQLIEMKHCLDKSGRPADPCV